MTDLYQVRVAYISSPDRWGYISPANGAGMRRREDVSKRGAVFYSEADAKSVIRNLEKSKIWGGSLFRVSKWRPAS